MIGIYKITNKIENKSYIGQSIHIEIRWKQHWYNRGKYPTLISQNLSKFDIEDFDFQIIEECTEEELNVKEEHYIKLFNTFKPFGYNMI